MNLKLILNFGALAALAVAGVSGCSVCQNEIVDKTTSPDGKWTATILTRDCGATTSQYMEVNLHDSSNAHLEARNNVFVTKYVRRLHVSWNGNDSLIVDCENCVASEVSTRMNRLGTIQIVYR